MFPKNQANPKRKNLPRVIASASVVDQLVCRVFFQRFTSEESDKYPNLCTKKGIGFDRDHAARLGPLFATNTARYGPPVISDVSGWEKNFTKELTFPTVHVMRRTCRDFNKFANRAARWWSHTLLSNICYLDDGSLIDFGDDKVQRSGNFLTTTSNGLARATLAYFCGSVPFCCGDDCNEWLVSVSAEQLKDNYASIGLPLRDVAISSATRFEFCSHVFTDEDGEWKCWLFSWKRTLWEAAHNSVHDPGSDANWIREFADMDDECLRNKIVDFIRARALLICHGGHEERKEC